MVQSVNIEIVFNQVKSNPSNLFETLNEWMMVIDGECSVSVVDID